MKNVFDRSVRYNKKIFVGKTGPVFNFKKKSAFNEKLKKLDKLKEKAEHSKKKEPEIILDNKKDPFNGFTMTDGFSIGIKPNKNLDLRRKRKEDYNTNNEKLMAFGFDNILKYNGKEREIRSITEGSVEERIYNNKMEIRKKNFAKTQKRLASFQKK